MNAIAHMQPEELKHAINKALECWSLQSLTDAAIMLSFVILAMVSGRCYLESVRRRLTLRVAAEVWEAGTDLLIDASMGFVALVGLFITNPDIMADIKIGLPWVPLAMVLMAAALAMGPDDLRPARLADRCTACGECVYECPTAAIVLGSEVTASAS
jgi:ferredoxin